MLRLIALVLFLVVSAFGYEQVTGNSIGVSRALSNAAAGVTAVFAGGYGMALGVGQSVLSGMGR